MADHQHVEVFIHGVDRIRPGRIRAGGQYVRQSTGLDDVRCMTTPGTFSVVSVYRAIFERGYRIFHKP